MQQPTCRCCLSVEGKFTYIHEVSTAQLYVDVVGVPVLTTDRFPQHLCTFCVRTLQKFAQFRARCHKVLEVLYQTVVQGTEETVEYTRNLTSNYQELKPQYTHTKTLLLDVLAPNNVNDVANPLDLPELYVEFKVEKEEKQSVSEIKDVIEELLEPKEECSKDVVYVEKGNETQYLEEDDHFDSFTDDFEEPKNEDPKSKKKKVDKVPKIKKLKEKVTKVTKVIKRKKKVKQKHKRESKSNKRVMMEFAESIGFNLTELSLNEQIQEIAEKKKDLSSGLICEQCGKRFNNFNCLKRHKNCHILKPNSFMCDLCSWVFQKKNLLIEHMLDHRYIFSCKSCDFKTKKRITLKGHHEFHQGKRFPCKYCDKVFEKLSSYFTHVRFKHESELPWCELCGEAFIGDKGVTSHKKLTHNILDEFPFECGKCKKRFRSKVALDRNIIVKGCDLPSCVHCGEAFPSDQLLKHHLIQRHIDGTVPNTYDCKHCILRFYNHDALMRHSCGCMAACAQCGDSFDSAQQLIDHVALRHDIFKCEECAKQFTSKHFKIHYMLKHSGAPKKRARARKRTSGALEDRVRKWRVVDGETIKQVETPPKPQESADEKKMTHICEVCGKGFLNSTKLSIHKWRVHCPDHCHRCPHCPKTFKTREALDIHIRVHTGERPYQCSQCPKAFKHRGAYTRHFLVHSGQRNHMCTMCEKTFQTSTGVKMHIQTAHMKMPWPAKSRRPKVNELLMN